MRILKVIIVLCIGMLFGCTSNRLLDQDYYWISKFDIMLLKQAEDSLYYYRCKSFNTCESLPTYSYKIVKYSSVTYNTKRATIIGKHRKFKAFKPSEHDITLTIDRNRRLELRNVSDTTKQENNGVIYFYPATELASLRPISEISKAEHYEIYQQIIPYAKSLENNKDDNHDDKIRKKYNDLIIKKGFNPISDKQEMSFRPKRY